VVRVMAKAKGEFGDTMVRWVRVRRGAGVARRTRVGVVQALVAGRWLFLEEAGERGALCSEHGRE
jgi:hypothetical protein